MIGTKLEKDFPFTPKDIQRQFKRWRKRENNDCAVLPKQNLSSCPISQRCCPTPSVPENQDRSTVSEANFKFQRHNCLHLCKFQPIVAPEGNAEFTVGEGRLPDTRLTAGPSHSLLSPFFTYSHLFSTYSYLLLSSQTWLQCNKQVTTNPIELILILVYSFE